MSIYRCNFVIISIQRLNLIQVWHPSYTVCVSAFYCTSVRISGLNQSKALISVEQNVTEYNVEYYKNNRQYTVLFIAEVWNKRSVNVCK